MGAAAVTRGFLESVLERARPIEGRNGPRNEPLQEVGEQAAPHCRSEQIARKDGIGALLEIAPLGKLFEAGLGVVVGRIGARQAGEDGSAAWLSADAAEPLLAPYGLAQVGRSARGRRQAVAAANSIGWPVVVKVSAPDVLHKSDRGLVRVGLTSRTAVEAAVSGFAAELGVAVKDLHLSVQPVVDGVELAAFVRAKGNEPDERADESSARNRLRGIVTAVVKDTVMAQVDIQCGPFRVVSLMSREAVDELDLQVGSVAVAVIKSTTVVVERSSPVSHRGRIG